MRPRRRLRRRKGAAGKGSVARAGFRGSLAIRDGKLSERGRTTSEAVAKRRARSLKRERHP